MPDDLNIKFINSQGTISTSETHQTISNKIKIEAMRCI